MIDPFGTVGTVVAVLFLIAGLFFLFVGSLGVLRLEDVFLRLQASSKSVTFGVSFFLAGAALLSDDWGVLAKAVVAIGFLFLTSPIAAQLIGLAAIQRGVAPAKGKPFPHPIPQTARRDEKAPAPPPEENSGADDAGASSK